MSVELIESHEGKVLTVRATGTLVTEDYDHFLPVMERLIEQHGKVRVLCEMHDFHGWKLGALWEDLKFDVKHYSDIERLAVVGEREWEKWMTVFCRPFTNAKIKYFDRSEHEKACEWIQEELPAHMS
jgi:SpoIIAA-like